MDGWPLMPPDAVEIVLDGLPVAFARMRVRFNPKSEHFERPMFEPRKQHEYRALLRLIAQQKMGGRKPLSAPLEVVIGSYFPIPRSWSKVKQRAAAVCAILPAKRPDIDNIVKLAKDAMNGVVYRDDAQIVSLRAIKRYDEKPRLEIRVEPI